MGHVNVKKADELLDRKFEVLNHGFIRLVDYMGSDESIVQAARVSYGKGTKRVSEDRALIRYLLRNKHTTPFEMVEFKFHVRLPIFVARQWIRHRTANVNEYSGRYSVLNNEFYIPQEEAIRFQSKINRQGRSDDEVPENIKELFLSFLSNSNAKIYKKYNEFLETGIARELARINLPLSVYTEWYWKIDLHNLFHFLRLRLDSHAQWEFRQYAKIMAEMVKTVCPIAFEAFMDYTVNSLDFSDPELSILSEMLTPKEIDIKSLIDRGLSKRESLAFIEKIKAISLKNKS